MKASKNNNLIIGAAGGSGEGETVTSSDAHISTGSTNLTVGSTTQRQQ